MKPIRFTQSGTVFTSPDPDIADLPAKLVVYDGDTPGIISAWSASFKERLLILIGKPLYLVVLSRTQPPILLSFDARAVGALDREEEKIIISPNGRAHL